MQRGRPLADGPQSRLRQGGSELGGACLPGLSDRVALDGADINESTLDMAGNCYQGLIQGNAIFLGHLGDAIPNTYTIEPAYTVFPYNCAGGVVAFSRQSQGQYRVKFYNNFHRGAMVSLVDGTRPATSVYVLDIGAGEFQVSTTDYLQHVVDADFELIVW